MKKKIFLFVFVLLSFTCFSQITITEIERKEELIVTKPEQYDSLKNWEIQENLNAYKQYIGLQVYLPPFENIKQTDNYFRYGMKMPFMFSTKPILINIDSNRNYLRLKNKWYQTSANKHAWKTIEYYQIYTPVWKPFHYISNSIMEVGVINSSESGNKYYTIIKILYANELKSVFKKLDSLLNSKEVEISTIYDQYIKDLGADFDSKFWENNPQKIFVDRPRVLNYDLPKIVFVLRDNIGNDTIYCTNIRNFILVPYFVKQKELFQNKSFIYYKGNSFEKSDARFLLKKEDDSGKEISTEKTIIIDHGSKWFCSDVTLLKPTYGIFYILKNEKDDQITLTKNELEDFMEESYYLEQEANRKLQSQQLLEKQKKDELKRKEIKLKAIEKHRTECIDKFGQELGSLIAEGKVKIGMTTEMCEAAWGKPFDKEKETTASRVTDFWFYGWSHSLYFINGILTKINE